MTPGVLERAVGHILQEANRLIQAIDADVLEEFVERLAEARRVFVYGAGRSGQVARAFAVRLWHLGYPVYVIGETISAPVKRGDVVLLVSGSGETYPVAMSAEIARNIGAHTLVLTANRRSKVASFGDVVIEFSVGPSTGQRKQLAPLGTLFETTSWILLDGVVAELMRRRRKTEASMRQRHATME